MMNEKHPIRDVKRERNVERLNIESSLDMLGPLAM
jgi:hypothetical protein